MIETTTPDKFVKWKRPLIGGFLSALIAEVVVIAMIQGYGGSNPFVYLFGASFAAPVLMILGVSFDSIVVITIIVFLFWFSAGALIGKSIKTNIHAIACWLLALVVCFFIAFGLSLFGV